MKVREALLAFRVLWIHTYPPDKYSVLQYLGDMSFPGPNHQPRLQCVQDRRGRRYEEQWGAGALPSQPELRSLSHSQAPADTSRAPSESPPALNETESGPRVWGENDFCPLSSQVVTEAIASSPLQECKPSPSEEITNPLSLMRYCSLVLSRTSPLLCPKHFSIVLFLQPMNQTLSPSRCLLTKKAEGRPKDSLWQWQLVPVPSVGALFVRRVYALSLCTWPHVIQAALKLFTPALNRQWRH